MHIGTKNSNLNNKNACFLGWQLISPVCVFYGSFPLDMPKVQPILSFPMRGAVVEWLEQLGYGVESRCIA